MKYATPETGTFKITFIGPKSSGKTSLIDFYNYQRFSETVPPTVGVTFFNNSVLVDSIQVRVSFYDTSGDESSKKQIGYFLRDAYAVVIVYDKSDDECLDNVKSYYESCKNILSKEIPVLFCATKADLTDSKSGPVEQWIESIGKQPHIVSSKDGTNVVQFFEETVKCIYANRVNLNNIVNRIKRKREAEIDVQSTDSLCC